MLRSTVISVSSVVETYKTFNMLKAPSCTAVDECDATMLPLVL